MITIEIVERRAGRVRPLWIRIIAGIIHYTILAFVCVWQLMVGIYEGAVSEVKR